ncbi:MAG TPA: ROK family protein [Gaiellaceae bacterium]|nr:ROK family protein [Gaiellaceae bacterium]
MASSAAVDDGVESLARGPVLGLDIGGTKLAAGVVDADGHVHGFAVAPSEPERGSDDGLTRLFELGRRALEASGLAVDSIGIGCGGPLDSEKGVLVAPLHLTGWRDVPVVELAERAFGVRAVLDNDATAAAAAEHRFGAGRGTQSMVYLTLSTGVGGGVVLDGRVFRGSTGNGGELGHVTIDWRGRPCRGCGRRGCLEAYVSGTSIAERAEEAGLRGATAADVADAARVGDPAAAKVWRETCEALASGITSIANLFEPELVVVGGGVSRQGEHLLGPVRELVEAKVIHAVRVVQSSLGDRVGVAGAAAVAFERLGAAVERV